MKQPSKHNTKIFLVDRKHQNLSSFKDSPILQNLGLWQKQCDNDIFIENVASIKWIIFARPYSCDNMTYLITSQISTQPFQPKVFLCKCNHHEIFHVDEEGHGDCRYCDCEEFDPQ